MSIVDFRVEAHLQALEFQDLLLRSGLAARRPSEDVERLQAMIDHSNLMVTARSDDGLLVGVARSVTDFAYCCYLSDLAVDYYPKKGFEKYPAAYVRHGSKLP